MNEEARQILADGKQTMENSCLCGICFAYCRARYRRSKLAEAKKADLDSELARCPNFRVNEEVTYNPADLILERSVREHREKWGELRDFYKTVRQRVKGDEKQHKLRTAEVGGWLKRVKDLLENEVLEILE